MRYYNIVLFILMILIIGCKNDQLVINDLKCEYLLDPLGIDILNPRLSWKLLSPLAGQKQTAYQILASTNIGLLETDKADLWNSGKIESDKSTHIVYSGEELSTGMQVFWKVRVWDAMGIPSAWSSPAKWEMGILPSDWQAEWISTPFLNNSNPGEMNPAYYFRKEIRISDDFEKAKVFISGLGYYEFYINGKKVGDHVLSPNHTNYDLRDNKYFEEAWVNNMASRVLYESFDISSLLQSGDNTLAVILGNGWYFQNERNEDVNYSYDTPRFISQLEIEFKDGTRSIIPSDESWKTSLGPIIHNGVFTGETYDARLEQKGWNTSGFNDSKWEKAIIIWPPEGKLVAQMSPPDRVTGVIKPISLTNPKKNIYRFDLGQMISGWAKLKVEGPAGTRLEMRFIEEMGPGYSQTDTYILKGGELETWEPRFTWHAFRYVDVNSSIPLDLESLEGIVVNTDVESSGEFQCSYPLFNKINDNFRRTQLGNMHGGVPSDCPHRERRGYTGDGQIAADAAIYNFDMAAFYTKWLNDIADSQNSKTGYIPNTAPYQGGGGGTPWGSAYVIIPWYMYLYYGDISVLEQHYGGMKNWIDFLNNQTDKNGIIQEKNLGEWVPPVKTEIPANLVSTAYYFHCLKLMSEIALVLKYNADSDYFLNLAKKTKLAFNEKYFDKETMSYSIGWQGANVFPLGFNLVPDEYKEHVFETLVNHIENETNGHFDTGMMGTPLLLKVLSNFNRPDLAFTLMSQRDFPSFGYQIDKGATTIWETWRGDASHSHPMFGGVCQWFFSSVAGINPDPNQPGFKHIIFKPQPVVNLKDARAVYQSMQGEIESSWEIVENEFILNVSIPANTTATVLIPAKIPEDVKATAVGSKTHDEISFIGFENNLASYCISSGKYEFTTKNARDLFLESMLTAPRIIPPDTILQMPDSMEVEIRTDHEEANIKYTLNGMEPDINSAEYLGAITISKSTTVKARVFKPGMKSSPIKSSTVTFINPEENGVQYEYYLGKWEQIPDMQILTPFATGKLQDINLDYLDLNKDKFALLLKTQINILEEGSYTFFLNSNDGSKLYIDNKLIIDNDGPHGAVEKQGSIILSEGKHSFVIHYFQAGGGYLLESSFSGPGISKSRIPPSILLLDN